MALTQVFFKHFASKNQLPGLSMSRKWVKFEFSSVLKHNYNSRISLKAIRSSRFWLSILGGEPKTCVFLCAKLFSSKTATGGVL